MRTTTIVLTEVQEKRVEKVSCNMCGKVAKHLDCTDINDLQFEFGYGSKYDMETWSFDLCDGCVDTLIKNFKIPPEVKDFGWDGIS